MKLFSSFQPPFFLFLSKIVAALSNSAITMRRSDLWSHKKSRSARGIRFFSLQVHRSKSRHLHALISKNSYALNLAIVEPFFYGYHCF